MNAVRDLPLLLLLASSCGGEGTSRGDGKAGTTAEARVEAGHQLYDLVKRTYPAYDTYDFDHMLVLRSESPQRVMDLLALAPGDEVGDIGCGSGFYTFLFAEKVGPTGRVWAIDVQSLAVRTVRERMAEPSLARFQNIRLFQNPVNETLIPADTLDAALLSHADFYAFPTLLDENRQMLGALYRSLVPGGRMVVVQDMTAKTIPDASNDVIVRNFADAGFRPARVQTDPATSVSYFQFLKPENGPAPPPVAIPQWLEPPEDAAPAQETPPQAPPATQPPPQPPTSPPPGGPGSSP